MSMAKHYSMEVEAEGTAKALGYEISMSPKDSYEVCKAIRGMTLGAAKKYLEDVLDHKRAIPFTRYNGKIKHRVGKMGPGGYPEKATKHILEVLKNAENNAEYKGLDPDNMFIMHSAANRGRQLKGRMPRAHGRSTEWNEQTTSIEIIIKEVEESKSPRVVESESRESRTERAKHTEVKAESKPADSRATEGRSEQGAGEARAGSALPKAAQESSAVDSRAGKASTEPSAAERQHEGRQHKETSKPKQAAKAPAPAKSEAKVEKEEKKE